MKGKIKLEFTVKQIAAGVTLLLGIILAIGYPTGGVKPHKKSYTLKNVLKKSVVSKPAVKQSTNTNDIIKKKVTKKKIVHPDTPLLNNDTDDEGC